MDGAQIDFIFTLGFDSSGNHSDFKQMSKVNFSTKQVMSVCFSIKEVKVKDLRGNTVKWCSSEHGSNKPQNVRPVSLFPAKEEKELLKEFIPVIEKEVFDLKNEGVEVFVGDEKTIYAKCKEANLTMVDGKMVTSLLQLEGAYCTMCTRDLLSCHKPDVINNGFVIDRTVESVRDLALSLTDSDTWYKVSLA